MPAPFLPRARAGAGLAPPAAEEGVARKQPVDQFLRAAPVVIEPGSFATFGYGAEGAPAENYLVIEGFPTPAGSYSTVSLAFTTNGITEFTSLVVPDVGYYAGYVPTD